MEMVGEDSIIMGECVIRFPALDAPVFPFPPGCAPAPAEFAATPDQL
jgi:hypothetical protein